MRALRLRALAALLACLWASAAAGQGGGAAGQGGGAATGFDHADHERQVDAGGGAAVACARCHAMDRRGRVASRLGHAACFGACHGPAPARARPEGPARRSVCRVCHEAESLERLGRARAPRPARDFALVMSHAAHDAPSQARGGCRACHAPGHDQARPGARAPATGQDAHARCARCHLASPGGPGSAGAGRLSMNDCAGCHVRAEVGARAPALASGPFRASFSHVRHQARGLGDCRGCHAAVLAAAGNQLEPPRTEACVGCHDGVQAFSVLGPACRRCHRHDGTRGESRPRRGPAYSHQAHQARGLDAPCSRCHQLDARGAPLAPARDHAPCSDAGCHREEFVAREPRICGPCHLGTEPWLRLYFQPQQRAETEFGARFSHRRHAQADAALVQACERCHRQPSQQRDLGLPAQHDTCMGAGCHALVAGEAERATGHPVGPTPLSGCTGCHERGLVAGRRARRLEAAWSVRERFTHAPHRRAPGTGAAVACTACHEGVADAGSVDEIPAPRKRACAPCHDGRAAFKLTGHGCARCHAGAPQP